MTLLTKLKGVVFSSLLLLSASVYGNDNHSVVLQAANTNILDTASLQRGANIYAQYCMGCHSMKYMRVSRVAKDLNWTPNEALVQLQVLRQGQAKLHDPMMATIDPANAKLAFGSLPPDLSLEARLKGTDWVYSFLSAYQRDEQGIIANAVFPGVAMPFVLEGMKQSMSPEDYQSSIRDLVNFLDYAAEPIKPLRVMLGWAVLAFLGLLFLLTYLLKQEFWRDVKGKK